jgi:hypothetical protein
MTVTAPPPRRPEVEHDRDLEQRVADLEALIEEARRRARRRQARRGIAALLLTGVGAVAFFGFGGYGGGDPGTAAVADKSPAARGAAHGKTFVSHRYHYSLAIPSGWKAIPAKRTIDAPIFPDAKGPATDTFVPATNIDKGSIGIASQPLKAGETLKAWTRTRMAAIASQYGCTTPERHPAKVAGVAATSLVYAECFGFFDDYEVVHGGRGYDIYWLGLKVNGVDVTFLQTLPSLRLQ